MMHTIVQMMPSFPSAGSCYSSTRQLSCQHMFHRRLSDNDDNEFHLADR